MNLKLPDIVSEQCYFKIVRITSLGNILCYSGNTEMFVNIPVLATKFEVTVKEFTRKLISVIYVWTDLNTSENIVQRNMVANNVHLVCTRYKAGEV